MSSLMQLSVLEQAKLVKSREVSPIELVEESIQQIEQINPKINAVVTPMFDFAREQAKKITKNGDSLGVPILLKDVLAEIKDWPISEGSKFLKGYRSDQTSELVSRYLKAGLIPMGRTNSPEFASMPTTEPQLYGPTKNPWNIEYSSGGSSGGSAAAVASGMVAVAHANDGGGSIRIPAASCGLVGLKPTRGRNPMGPQYGDIGGAGILCEHVVTRSVADNALLLDISSGPDAGCPYSPQPHKSYLLDATHPSDKKYKIAVSTEALSKTEVDEECKLAVQKTAEVLENLGHTIAIDSPSVDASEFSNFFTTVWISMVGWMIDDWSSKLNLEPQAKFFETHTWKMYQAQSNLSPAQFLMAVHKMQAFSRKIAPFFDQYDVLLTPTSTRAKCPLGYFDFNPEKPRQATTRMEDIPKFTAIANVTGQPAISLPMHWTKDGFPVGIQILGKYGDEATLYQLSSQLESAAPWKAHYQRVQDKLAKS